MDLDWYYGIHSSYARVTFITVLTGTFQWGQMTTIIFGGEGILSGKNQKYQEAVTWGSLQEYNKNTEIKK